MLEKGKHHLHSSGLCDCVSRTRFIEARSQCCGFGNVFDKVCLALGLSLDILGACGVMDLWHAASRRKQSVVKFRLCL